MECGKKEDESVVKLSAAETQILAEVKQLHVKFGEVSKVSSRVDKLTTEMEGIKQTVANIVAATQTSALSAAAPAFQAPAVPAGGAAGGLPQLNVVARNNNRRYIKCANCEERRIFCRHCNNCGLEGHKRRDCPTLNPNA